MAEQDFTSPLSWSLNDSKKKVTSAFYKSFTGRGEQQI